MVALAGVPVVVAVTWLLRRRARAAGARQAHRPVARRRLRHRGWLPALAASTGAAGVMAVAVLGCCVTGATPAAAAPPAAPTPVAQGRVLTEVEVAAAGAGGSSTVVVLDADGQSLVISPGPGAPTYPASLVEILVVTRLLDLDGGGSLSLTDEGDANGPSRGRPRDRPLIDRAVSAALVPIAAGELPPSLYLTARRFGAPAVAALASAQRTSDEHRDVPA